MKETAKWTNCPLTGEPFICLLFCTLSFVYLSSSLCTLETLCFARVQSSLWFAISAAMQNMNIVQSGQSRFSIIHPPETLLGNWTGATFGGPCSSKSVSNKAAPPVYHLHQHYHTAIIGKVTNNKIHTQPMMKGDAKKWTQLKEQCNEGRERGRTMAEHDYCCWQGHHPPDTHALTHSLTPTWERVVSECAEREWGDNELRRALATTKQQGLYGMSVANTQTLSKSRVFVGEKEREPEKSEQVTQHNQRDAPPARPSAI